MSRRVAKKQVGAYTVYAVECDNDNEFDSLLVEFEGKTVYRKAIMNVDVLSPLDGEEELLSELGQFVDMLNDFLENNR